LVKLILPNRRAFQHKAIPLIGCAENLIKEANNDA